MGQETATPERGSAASAAKPPFWETPRNLVIITGAAAAASAALFGFLGYRDGQAARQPYLVQVIFQPGAIVVPPVTKQETPP